MEKPLDSQTALPGIDFNNNHIIIVHKSTPILIHIILISILAICAILPVVVSILVVFNSGPHFGLLILFLFFWGFGFMLLRVVLWNTYGREILSLRENKIEYLADYKYFKDARQEIQTDELKIEIIFEAESDFPAGRLRLENDSKKIETVLQANIEDLERLTADLKKRYGLRSN